MRQKNTLEYLGLWERLYNPFFKGAEFGPLLAQAGSNSFTMSPSRWVELTGSIGIITKNGAGGGTFAQQDIAFKFANWVSVEFELYLVKEFQRLNRLEKEAPKFAVLMTIVPDLSYLEKFLRNLVLDSKSKICTLNCTLKELAAHRKRG